MFRRNQKSEWAKALESVLEQQTEEVPSGWLKLSEIAKQMNLSEEQAGKTVTILKNRGLVEMKKFKIRTDKKTKMIRATCHYRLIFSSKGTHPKASASGKS